MSTSEQANASLGPRYAPDDPTLPSPWKGLIDGSSGVLYYWNPDTGVTQYDRPSPVTPQVPAGMPPSGATPTPGAVMMQGHQGQQMVQISQHQGQQTDPLQQNSQLYTQGLQQHSSQSAQAALQQGAQQDQALQHQGHLAPQQFRQQALHQPNQQGMMQSGQQLPHSSVQQMHQQQPIQQLPVQQTNMYQGSQMGQPQGNSFAHQQMPYPQYSHTNFSQGQQFPQPQSQGHIFPPQQEQKSGYQPKEEPDSQKGKQIGFSSQLIQQHGGLSAQNVPAGVGAIPMQQVGGQAHGQQFSNSSRNMQQHSSLVSQSQGGIDLHRQHGPGFHNQLLPNQQPSVAPVASKMGYEENVGGRAGSEYFYNAPSDGPSMVPQQPKLASIPMTRNQQESRMGGHGHPNMNPSSVPGMNSATGPPLHNVYGHATAGPQFPNNTTRPPSMMMDSSGTSNQSSVQMYCQTHEVTATGGNVPAPFITFEETGFPPELLRELHLAGFASPTPIQAQTWPIAIKGRDIVAIAKTGSGKTLGYLIPAFLHLQKLRNNPQNGPTVVVLAPTRELATQIQNEANKFGRSSRVLCTCLYGGAPKGPQLKELERGTDIIVATPGRLNDILEMRKVDFRQVSLIVLDEADRMLDMGFEPQIMKIVNEIPPRRQTLMYTATWPKEVMKIASDLLRNPVQVTIGSVDELEANKSITQHVEMVPPMEKERRLEQILRSQERGSKIIVFCATKRMCDQLTRTVGRNFRAAAIHGDKSQVDRDMVLNQFRSGAMPVLIATDVAARGLDVKDIRVVINYDFPTGIEDYVHRIGRTGRAGATGVAYTFLWDSDSKHAPDLVKVLEGANQQVPPALREMASRGPPMFNKDRGGPNRFDSGGGGGRWESGGRGGMRDGGFGGRGDMRDGDNGGRGGGMRDNFGGTRDGGFGGRGGGMRDGSFGGRGGMRDGGFGGRGGMRDDGFGGRGGMRDGGFGGRGGMRDGGFGGRGGGGFGGQVGWDRNDRGGGPQDRFGGGGMDRGSRGGRGRGGRFDNRRDVPSRGSRGRSYSPSPERGVRTWGGRSRSRSRSRSWSRGRSRSRSRSWSRSRSRSYSRSRSRSPRRNYVRPDRPPRKSKFDQMEPDNAAVATPGNAAVPQPQSDVSAVVITSATPGNAAVAAPGIEPSSLVENAERGLPEAVAAEAEPSNP